MTVWATLGRLVSPILNAIDNLHTSEEERLKIKFSLLEFQAQLASELIQYESKLAESKAKVIEIEAQGNSFLQTSWRPITMLTFLILVIADTFGLTEFRLSSEAWELLKIGVGGYVVGRSTEKVVNQITDAISKGDNNNAKHK